MLGLKTFVAGAVANSRYHYSRSDNSSFYTPHLLNRFPIKPSPAVVNHGGSRSLGSNSHEAASVSTSSNRLGQGTLHGSQSYTDDVTRHTFKKASNLLKTRLSEAVRPLNGELQPIIVRNSPRQPIHPIARLRQAKGRWYTTHSTINAAVRRFMSTGKNTLRLFPEALPGNNTDFMIV